MATQLLNCVACGSAELEVYLDLGNQALANDFHDGTIEGRKFPLRVARCLACTHSQLMEAIDPSRLFKHYSYVSGTTATLKEYFDSFARSAWDKYLRHRPLARVLDIACNDGTLLESFRELGCEVFGVDPAENLREITLKKNIDVEVGFWNCELAEKLNGFDLIVAFNVLAHTACPLDFLKACQQAMKYGAHLFVQTSQADWLAAGQFDCVYHEHISYFTLPSMRALVRRAGFDIVANEIAAIHGGSLLVDLVNPYNDIRLSVLEFREHAQRTIAELKASGWTVCGYGAAAKGSVVVQSAHLELDWVVDDNPLKTGRFMPGTLIPVVKQSALLAPEKLAVVLLAWNFADEIKKRVLAVRSNRATCFVKLPAKVEYEVDGHFPFLQ